MEESPMSMDFCTKKDKNIWAEEKCVTSKTDNLDFLSGITPISSLGQSKAWLGRRFDEWNLIYVNSGALEILPDDGFCRIEEKSFVLIAPGHPRKYRCSADTSLLFFHFKLEGHVDTVIKWDELLPGFSHYTPDHTSRRRCIAALFEAHSLAMLRRQGWYNLAYSLIATVINRGNACAVTDDDDKSLAQAALMLSRLTRIPDMDQVAASCGLSRTLFYDKFHKLFGVSPRVYREQHLFRYAQSMLENTDYTLERIAGEIGVKDAFYFSRRFKLLYGVPPAEYRRRLAHGKCY